MEGRFIQLTCICHPKPAEIAEQCMLRSMPADRDAAMLLGFIPNYEKRLLEIQKKHNDLHAYIGDQEPIRFTLFAYR